MNLLLLSPHGRSGSLLMHSLFDQHPEVFSLPTFFHYPNWEYHNSTMECINNFIKFYPDIFDISQGYLGVTGKNTTSMFGEKGNENIQVSKSLFVENAKKIFRKNLQSGILRKDFVLGIHKAYSQTLGIQSKKSKFLLLHFHGYDDKSHYLALEDFPNLKYIAMIRDPRENWLSVKTVFNVRIPFLNKFPYRCNLYKNTITNRDDINNLIKFSQNTELNQIKIVDLNRLHSLKDEGMKSISKWLKIDFSDVLMKSTFVGKLWHGNAANRKSIIGLDQQKAKFKWPNMISEFEINFIENELKKELIEFKYELKFIENNSSYYKYKSPSIFEIFFYHTLIFISEFIELFFKKNFSNKYKNSFPIFIIRILAIIRKLTKTYKIFLLTRKDFISFKNNYSSSIKSSQKINATFL